MWINSILAILVTLAFLIGAFSYAWYMLFHEDLDEDLGSEYDPEPVVKFRVTTSTRRFKHLIDEVVERNEKTGFYFNDRVTVHPNTVSNGSVHVKEI